MNIIQEEESSPKSPCTKPQQQLSFLFHKETWSPEKGFQLERGSVTEEAVDNEEGVEKGE